MTLKIEAPEVERRVRSLAKTRGVTPEQMVLGLLEAQLPKEETGYGSRPFHETASAEEWIAALDRWADHFPTDAPTIPDEALQSLPTSVLCRPQTGTRAVIETEF